MSISNSENIVEQYLGIQYKEFGRDRTGLDCYGLILLFYNEQLNIKLPDFHKDHEDKTFTFSSIKQTCWSLFKRIESPKKYDLAAFTQLGGKLTNHIGIMIDDNSFLHVPKDQMVVVNKLSHRQYEKAFRGFFKINHA